MTDFNTIAVLGLGTMGAGIAQVVARSGRSVVALEADEQRLDDGLAAVAAFLDGSVERGKLAPDERDAVLGRITGTTDVADLSSAEAVVESVSEQLEIKVALLERVAAVVGLDVPLLTNTSALSVTDLAARLPHPERVAGLHFFNPAPLMRTVEVVRALQTGETLVERLVALVGTFADKDPVVVDDRPGFLVNALLLPYLNDVIGELDAGLATAEDLDVALELGLGYRTGPMRMLDVIGLDVHLHATEAIHAATGDARYAAPPLLRRMVAAGRLGDKSGHGFRVTPDNHHEGQ
ncbi:3-hydroxyacyl-CoA dehydrogenase family protein [Aeromicrobium sp. IC_218]|uniref:3-hydroxyacyl-CoA dehydrogenase family protein n=1 Tax=Aeromicrobium sp. IC_218 TaxID=2545468 RepID=UPI00103C24F3|nr:3-hydroxyacyl-CoA dehydrogenase family protein [Aeromicrobium sp. IC_218]TCI96389.1 3-hydroxyacyl-CoA dehydrogenase family protein [Aeromicrobium sp. IC_218]